MILSLNMLAEICPSCFPEIIRTLQSQHQNILMSLRQLYLYLSIYPEGDRRPLRESDLELPEQEVGVVAGRLDQAGLEAIFVFSELP